MNDTDLSLVEWIKATSVKLSGQAPDLSELRLFKDIVRDARLVCFGESQHYVREFNHFRTALFKYLVTELGFSTFVFESDLLDGRIVNDYVLGRHDRSDEAFTAIGKTFGMWQGTQDVIEWMREENRKRSADSKIRFYGMDGTGNWSNTASALEAVLRYLDRVDPKNAKSIRVSLMDHAYSIELENVGLVPKARLQELLDGIARVHSLLHYEQMHYLEESTVDEFDWALRAAESAMEIASILREVRCAEENPQKLWWNLRDSGMARQLFWIYQRERARGGILVGAHNIHLQRVFARESGFPQATMGQYLFHRLGDQMITIAGTNGLSLKPGDLPIPGSFQAILSKASNGPYVIRLDRARHDRAIALALEVERPERTNTIYHPVRASRAWDAIVYFDSIQLDQLSLPPSLQRKEIVTDIDLTKYIGIYDVDGIVGMPVVLRISLVDGVLRTDGSQSDGELFPMHPSTLYPIDETRFAWKEWPLEVQFGEASSENRQTLLICKIGEYTGYRGEARA